MERFAGLTPEEVSVLRWGMYILMDDYEISLYLIRTECIV